MKRNCPLVPVPGDPKLLRCPNCGREKRSQLPPAMVRLTCGVVPRGGGEVRLRLTIQPSRSRPRQEVAEPSLVRKAWNLTKAVAAFVADGCQTVDEAEYARRLAICEPCEQRRGNSCRVCGCGLSKKAKGRVFECPLGKWASAEGGLSAERP